MSEHQAAEVSLIQQALDHAYERGRREALRALTRAVNHEYAVVRGPIASELGVTLAGQVARMRAALAFYANPTSYHLRAGDVLDDNGERARAALARDPMDEGEEGE